VTEIHTEILQVDRLATYSVTPLVRNTHYFKLTTDCLTLTHIPYIEDKETVVGELLETDWDDTYTMPEYCVVDTFEQWTGYQLL